LLNQHQRQGDNVNGSITVTVLDEPGQGGACHDYSLRLSDGDQWIINFQNGSVDEAGPNGVTHEALLAVLIDRLEGFQSGQYASPFNEKALEHLRGALQALNDRTAERQLRGVEGTNEV
jgi:hypothetical protein